MYARLAPDFWVALAIDSMPMRVVGPHSSREIGELRVLLLALLDRWSFADARALCLQHFCSQSRFPENSVRISVRI